MAVPTSAMVVRLFVTVTVLFNVANCFSLMATGDNPDAGNGGIPLALVSGVEEGRPTGPSRSDVVRAWLRALMTSQESSRQRVQRRMILDDTDEDVERNEGEIYTGDGQRTVGNNWQAANVRPSGQRRQVSEVSAWDLFILSAAIASGLPFYERQTTCRFLLHESTAERPQNECRAPQLVDGWSLQLSQSSFGVKNRASFYT
jgi:Arc/MetJ-type ribon-helix-helix transcriptional regulator